MTSTVDFEKRISETILRHQLLHHHSPVIVALSGGADSVALLLVLLRLGYDCRAAHCNFHLRGDESQRDMEWCQEIARRLEVQLYIQDFDVEAYRRANASTSVEMACRELRYEWFYQLARECQAQAIAVGHHSEDRVETFILNLMRGAGLTGLTSMRPRRDLIVRPLLEVTRADIEQYLSLNHIEYVIDSTNESNDYARNKVRNRLMPLFEELFPGAQEAILRSVSNLESTQGLYEIALRRKRDTYILSDGSINLESLSADADAQVLLFEFIRDKGFNMSQALDMLVSTQKSGQRFYSKGGEYVAENDHGLLRFVEMAKLQSDEDVYPIQLTKDISTPITIHLTRHFKSEFRPTSDPNIAYFDARLFDEDAQWSLRHWRRGDVIVPFGSRSRKLVSDIFRDAKFSAAQKRQQWLLLRNEEVVWLPGLRATSWAVVGANTTEFVKLTYVPE